MKLIEEKDPYYKKMCFCQETSTEVQIIRDNLIQILIVTL